MIFLKLILIMEKEYIIYKIFCKDENIKDCYIGSTTNLNRRWIEHKSVCNNKKVKEYNYKLYKFIRENGGINNFNIVEIEKIKCNKKNSFIKERYWVEELKSNLNSEIPSRTKKEYDKIYYENNKEKFFEKVKCECGCEISKKNLNTHLKTKKHLNR